MCSCCFKSSMLSALVPAGFPFARNESATSSLIRVMHLRRPGTKFFSRKPLPFPTVAPAYKHFTQPAWMIPPIGICMAAGTGHALGAGSWVHVFFYTGLMFFVFLLPAAIYRVCTRRAPAYTCSCVQISSWREGGLNSHRCSRTCPCARVAANVHVYAHMCTCA